MAKCMFEGVNENSRRMGVSVRPEKFQFMEKWQNRNFDYKIVILVRKIRNLFSRSWMTKRISPLESSRET